MQSSPLSKFSVPVASGQDSLVFRVLDSQLRGSGLERAPEVRNLLHSLDITLDKSIN